MSSIKERTEALYGDPSEDRLFRVTRVIDGDTFEVESRWSLRGERSGNRVRIAGIDAEELHAPGGEEAKRQIEEILSGRGVYLRNRTGLSHRRLVCTVVLEGVEDVR